METFSTVLAGALIVFLSSFLMAIPVWLLWNGVMPDIFGLPVITLWQALGLSVLSSLLFKSASSSKD